MPIYTKKGDKGETGLPGKRRLSKTDQLFDVLGGLDQTSAILGIVESFVDSSKDKSLVSTLQHIQENFLAIGACLAAENPSTAAILGRLPGETAKLEKQIDRWDAKLPKLENFILTGGQPAGATLHLARTIIRQTERSYHRMPDKHKLEAISIYLNRLSDFFFQAARFYNYLHGTPEAIWKSPRA